MSDNITRKPEVMHLDRHKPDHNYPGKTKYHPHALKVVHELLAEGIKLGTRGHSTRNPDAVFIRYPANQSPGYRVINGKKKNVHSLRIFEVRNKGYYKYAGFPVKDQETKGLPVTSSKFL
jgi:hypothetical protein